MNIESILQAARDIELENIQVSQIYKFSSRLSRFHFCPAMPCEQTFFTAHVKLQTNSSRKRTLEPHWRLYFSERERGILQQTAQQLVIEKSLRALVFLARMKLFQLFHLETEVQSDWRFNGSFSGVTNYAWELLAYFLLAVYEYAFTLVHQLDPMSEGRDVLQLKTGLSSMISIRRSFAKCVHYKPLMQSFVAAK